MVPPKTFERPLLLFHILTPGLTGLWTWQTGSMCMAAATSHSVQLLVRWFSSVYSSILPHEWSWFYHSYCIKSTGLDLWFCPTRFSLSVSKTVGTRAYHPALLVETASMGSLSSVSYLLSVPLAKSMESRDRTQLFSAVFRFISPGSSYRFDFLLISSLLQRATNWV